MEASVGPNEDPTTFNPSLSQDALAPNDNPQSPDESPGPGGQSNGQPFQAGGGVVPEEPSVAKDNDDNSGGDTPGGGDSEGDMQEKLSTDQLQAGISKAATGGMDDLASGDVEGQAKKMISKVNHGIYELEQDALIPFDCATFGISLIITIPIRLVFCAFFIYQLRNAINGKKGLFELTWESFMPPGTEISLSVMPPIALYVSVIVYIMTVVFLGIILTCLLGVICMVFAGEVSMLGDTFSFFKEFLGF